MIRWEGRDGSGEAPTTATVRTERRRAAMASSDGFAKAMGRGG